MPCPLAGRAPTARRTTSESTVVKQPETSQELLWHHLSAWTRPVAGATVGSSHDHAGRSPAVRACAGRQLPAVPHVSLARARYLAGLRRPWLQRATGDHRESVELSPGEGQKTDLTGTRFGSRRFCQEGPRDVDPAQQDERGWPRLVSQEESTSAGLVLWGLPGRFRCDNRQRREVVPVDADGRHFSRSVAVGLSTPGRVGSHLEQPDPSAVRTDASTDPQAPGLSAVAFDGDEGGQG